MTEVGYKCWSSAVERKNLQLKERICRMWLEQYVYVFIYVIGTEGKLFNPRGKYSYF